jgi:hypothetical protein
MRRQRALPLHWTRMGPQQPWPSRAGNLPESLQRTRFHADAIALDLIIKSLIYRCGGGNNAGLALRRINFDCRT